MRTSPFLSVLVAVACGSIAPGARVAAPLGPGRDIQGSTVALPGAGGRAKEGEGVWRARPVLGVSGLSCLPGLLGGYAGRRSEMDLWRSLGVGYVRDGDRSDSTPFSGAALDSLRASGITAGYLFSNSPASDLGERPLSVGGEIAFTDDPRPHFPSDLGKWSDHVRRLVERYDGDGKDDLPGRPRIETFHFGNEMELFYRVSPEEYAVCLRILYRAVKEANPRAMVVLGASAVEGAWRDTGPLPAKRRLFHVRVLKELARLERIEGMPEPPQALSGISRPLKREEAGLLFSPDDFTRYFDAVDVHFYRSARDCSELVPYLSRVRRVLGEFGYPEDLPLIIGEAGTWVGRRAPVAAFSDFPIQTARDQAAFLAKTVVTALSFGCRIYLWFVTVDTPQLEEQYRNHTLVDDRGEPRPAYWTYRLLAQRLGRCENPVVERLPEAPDGAVVVRIRRRGGPFYVAWSEPGSEARSISLPLAAPYARLTALVPEEGRGKEPGNPAGAFDVEIEEVRAGKVSLELRDVPVLVEGTDRPRAPVPGGQEIPAPASPSDATSEHRESPFGIWDGALAPDWKEYLGELAPSVSAVVVPPLFFDKRSVEAGWPDLRRIYEEHLRLGIAFIPLNDLEHGGIDMPLAEFAAAVRKAVGTFPEMRTIMIGCEADGGAGAKVGGRPRDYALRIRVAYRAVKAVRPSCRVAVGGTLGRARSYDRRPEEGARAHPLHNTGYFDAVFRELERLERIEKDPKSYDRKANPLRLSKEEFDLVFSPDSHEKYQDIHHISLFVDDHRLYRDEKRAGVVRAVKALLYDYGYRGTEIWITQTGTHSGTIKSRFPGPPQTEREQAISLVRQYLLYRSWGVKKIFWVSTVEFDWPEQLGGPLGAPGNPHHYFSLVGLIHNGKGEGDPGYGVRKLAFYTYRLLVERLGKADWDRLELVRDDRAVVFRLWVEGEPVYVAWREPTAPGPPLRPPLPGPVEGGPVSVGFSIDGGFAVVTSLIPSEKEGKDIHGNRATFASRRVAAAGGRVMLELTEEPVLIEGGQ